MNNLAADQQLSAHPLRQSSCCLSKGPKKIDSESTTLHIICTSRMMLILHKSPRMTRDHFLWTNVTPHGLTHACRSEPPHRCTHYNAHKLHFQHYSKAQGQETRTKRNEHGVKTRYYPDLLQPRSSTTTVDGIKMPKVNHDFCMTLTSTSPMRHMYHMKSDLLREYVLAIDFTGRRNATPNHRPHTCTARIWQL